MLKNCVYLNLWLLLLNQFEDRQNSKTRKSCPLILKRAYVISFNFLVSDYNVISRRRHASKIIFTNVLHNIACSRMCVVVCASSKS